MHTHYNSSVKQNKSSDGGKCYERCVHFHASTNPQRLVWFGGMAVHKRWAAVLSHTAKTHTHANAPHPGTQTLFEAFTSMHDALDLTRAIKTFE